MCLIAGNGIERVMNHELASSEEDDRPQASDYAHQDRPPQEPGLRPQPALA